MYLRIAREHSQLRLDCAQDPGDFLWSTAEVIGREDPQGDCRDRKIGAPAEEVIKLLGAGGIDRERVA